MAITGIFSQPYSLKLLVAASSTFQTVVGAANATAALAYIHFPRAEESDSPSWAIVSDEDTPLRREKKGTGYWADEGSLMLSFDFFVPGDNDDTVESSEEWFLQQAGDIISDMEALAGEGEPVAGQTHLAVLAFVHRDGPWELDTAEFGELPDLDEESAPSRLWHASFDVEF